MRTFLMAGVMTLAMDSAAMALASIDIAASGALFLICVSMLGPFGVLGALLAVILAPYFLPAIIGSNRGVNASGALFFVNLIVGWTVLGWIVCLIWAVSGATKAQDAFYKNANQPVADPDAYINRRH